MRSVKLLKHRNLVLFVVLQVFFTWAASAVPMLATYQAKIIKPNGLPLEEVNVNFKFSILNPLGTCVLYSETFSAVNMASTGGVISFALGTGIKTYPVSAVTFADVFNNSTSSLSCDGGGLVNYSPSWSDIRKIVMQFHDGNGWQTLPAMSINAVPYAMYANDTQMLGGVSAAEFVQSSMIPSCGSTEAIHFNGASFSCVLVGGSGAITSSSVITALGFTPATGASVTSLALSLSTTDSTVSAVSSSVFSVSSTVSSLADTVSTLQSTVSASFAAITSSQWVTSGTTIYYNAGNVGIGTANPVTKLEVSGGVRISMESATCAAGLAGTLRYNAGNVEYCNGFTWSAFGVATSGLAALNASTSQTQTFATGITGTAFSISTVNGVHAFNIPLAASGSVTAGLLSNADYVTFTNKLNATSAAVISTLGYIPADNAASGTYAQKANNLSDLTNIPQARTNLGLGGLATANSIDLGSASATGIIADSRLQTQSNVASGAQYTKVTVDGKGRVTSGAQLSSSDVTTALGYTPADNAASGTYLVKASNLSDLTSVILARSNLGLGGFATISSLDLGSASATGTLDVARLPSFVGDATIAAGSNTIVLSNSGVSAGTYSKVTVDAKGRVTSSSALSSADITTALGYTPATSTSLAASFVQKTGDTMTGTLNLALGTTTNAPLKLTSGTLLSSAQSGAIEYDGSQLYFTDGLNARRAIATNSSQGSFDNTSLISNSSGNITLSPNNITGSVIVNSSAASISSGTGALVVNGGVGIAGNINAAGSLNLTGSATIGQSFSLSSMTSGSLLFSGASGLVSEDNSRLFWDGANKRLGLGTNSPAQTLSVSGSSYFSGNVGIGAINPQAKLHVLGDGSYSGVGGGLLRLSGATNTNIRFEMGLNTSTNVGFLQAYVNGGSTQPISLNPDGGNIGIGNASPSSTLTIGSNIGSGYAMTANSTSAFGVSVQTSEASPSTNPAFWVRTTPDSGTTVNTLFRVQNNGKVGVGTANPQTMFEVVDGASGVVRLSAGIGQFNNLSRQYSVGGLASSTSFSIRDDSAAGTPTRLEIDLNGKVGVGSSPVAAFDVYNSGEGRLYVHGNIDSNLFNPATVWGSGSGSNGLAIGWNRSAGFRETNFVNIAPGGVPGGFTFDTWNGTSYINRMKISSSGYVGIGVSNPTVALQIGTTGSWNGTSGLLIKGVNPGIEITDIQSTPQRWLIGNGVTVGDGKLGLAYNISSGTHNLVVQPDGKIGMGTSSPSEKLHVVGNLRVQGSTDCTLGNGSGGTSCSSDIRLKENVTPIINSLDKILSLRGVEFDWNEKSVSFGRHDIGVIAQEVEKVFPTAVINDRQTGMKKVDYAVLVAPIIQAIKELRDSEASQMSELKKENKILKDYLCKKDPEVYFCK